MPLDDFVLDADRFDTGGTASYQRPLRLRSQRASATNEGGGGYYREFYTVGDTAPDLRAQCMDGTGAPIDLTGATAHIQVASRWGGLVEWVDATTGLWSYSLAATDLSEPGEWTFELHVVLPSGATMTFPSQEQDRPVFVVRNNLAVAV